MKQRSIQLIGIPQDSGKRRKGCLMGPDAYRTACIAETLQGLGHEVQDIGNLTPELVTNAPKTADHIYALKETIGWTQAIKTAGAKAGSESVPIFMGGDHALALGSVPAMADRAARENKPFFVLWLDAHADFNTPETTASGNLHGTPMAYATGQSGFAGFPDVENPVAMENICMIGLRSVDRPERDALQASDMAYVDMRAIDENGIAKPLSAFLQKVADQKGTLHVSLDVDFIDPEVAPAVGTTVPGGATMREAHLVMEMLHDSGLMSSLDLVELNPYLDERGKTASVMVDLTASAFGRKIFDRPTRAFN